MHLQVHYCTYYIPLPGFGSYLPEVQEAVSDFCILAPCLIFAPFKSRANVSTATWKE